MSASHTDKGKGNLCLPLKLRVVFVCLFFYLFLISFSSASFYFYQKNNILRTVENSISRIAKNLENLSITAFKNNIPEILQIGIHSEFQNQNIHHISFKPAIQLFPSIDYTKNEDKNNNAYSLLVSRAVIYSNKVLGIYEILFAYDKEMASLHNGIIKIFLYSMVLSLVIVIFFYFYLRKKIWKPAEELSEAIRKISNHNFSCRVFHESEDEIGIICKNLNSMAESIQYQIEDSLNKVWTDLVTNLPNRNKILIDIEKASNPTLILINIDYFKEINDCYGNKIGDLVLKETASRLQKYQDSFSYQLYKMPSDEFALLFNYEMEKERLIEIVKIISNEINEIPYNLDEYEINVHVTLGIARGSDIPQEQKQEGKWRKLATSADMALKRAKRYQKHFVVYDESLEIPKEYENNILWKQKLNDAIHNERIVPFFQPIVNNLSRKIEKYESLVRLIDKHGKVINPSHFLELAKKNHLYHNITKTMMIKTFHVFRDLEYEFSINLTVFDILDEELNIFIKKQLYKNQETAKRLVFEILESEGIENYKEVMIFIEEVKELGCKIAIDDFGSGYSNFEHIMRLNVDYIKIDSSLIKNLPQDKNAQIITRTIANFAKELGLKTISEFVHSKEVFEKGVELGIDYSQGFYFGEPKETLM